MRRCHRFVGLAESDVRRRRRQWWMWVWSLVNIKLDGSDLVCEQ